MRLLFYYGHARAGGTLYEQALSDAGMKDSSWMSQNAGEAALKATLAIAAETNGITNVSKMTN
jgi:hypothetical protein